MRFLSHLLLVGSAWLTACSTTTVYIVRHAEKVNETDTTNLSTAGYARADDLARILRHRSIDSVFTTPYRRTRQSAQPLAQQLNLPLLDYAASPVQPIVHRISRMRHKTVLVVGHSNTILAIAKGLGASPVQTQIAPGDFDNLFRIRLTHGPFRRFVRFKQTTYGQPTPP